MSAKRGRRVNTYGIGSTEINFQKNDDINLLERVLAKIPRGQDHKVSELRLGVLCVSLRLCEEKREKLICLSA